MDGAVLSVTCTKHYEWNANGVFVLKCRVVVQLRHCDVALVCDVVHIITTTGRWNEGFLVIPTDSSRFPCFRLYLSPHILHVLCL